jgi:hypothetical protein
VVAGVGLLWAAGGTSCHRLRSQGHGPWRPAGRARPGCLSTGPFPASPQGICVVDRAWWWIGCTGVHQIRTVPARPSPARAGWRFHQPHLHLIAHVFQVNGFLREYSLTGVFCGLW